MEQHAVALSALTRALARARREVTELSGGRH